MFRSERGKEESKKRDPVHGVMCAAYVHKLWLPWESIINWWGRVKEAFFSAEGEGGEARAALYYLWSLGVSAGRRAKGKHCSSWCFEAASKADLRRLKDRKRRTGWKGRKSGESGSWDKMSSGRGEEWDAAKDREMMNPRTENVNILTWEYGRQFKPLSPGTGDLNVARSSVQLSASPHHNAKAHKAVLWCVSKAGPQSCRCLQNYTFLPHMRLSAICCWWQPFFSNAFQCADLQRALWSASPRPKITSLY